MAAVIDDLAAAAHCELDSGGGAGRLASGWQIGQAGWLGAPYSALGGHGTVGFAVFLIFICSEEWAAAT